MASLHWPRAQMHRSCLWVWDLGQSNLLPQAVGNVGKMNQTDSTSTRCRVGIWDHQMHHDLTAYKAYKACWAHYLCLPSGSSTHPLCELSPSPAVHSLFCHGGKSAFEDLTTHTAHYGPRQALRQISGGVAAAAQSHLSHDQIMIKDCKFHVTKAPLKRQAFNPPKCSQPSVQCCAPAKLCSWPHSLLPIRCGGHRRFGQHRPAWLAAISNLEVTWVVGVTRLVPYYI